MNEEIVADKFIGLTKIQFLAAILGVTLILSVVVTFSTAYTVTANRARVNEIAKLAEQSTVALCAQRVYFDAQIANTNQFLAEHLEPVPIAGITRESIVAGRDRQVELRASLDGIDCPVKQ